MRVAEETALIAGVLELLAQEAERSGPLSASSIRAQIPKITAAIGKPATAPKNFDHRRHWATPNVIEPKAVKKDGDQL